MLVETGILLLLQGMRKQGERMWSKRSGEEDRNQSNPHGLVQSCSAWAVLCGSIFEPWSYLCVPPSLILSTWTSCCDGPCVTTLLYCCLAPHQLSSANPRNSSIRQACGNIIRQLSLRLSLPVKYNAIYPSTHFFKQFHSGISQPISRISRSVWNLLILHRWTKIS